MAKIHEYKIESVTASDDDPIGTFPDNVAGSGGDLLGSGSTRPLYKANITPTGKAVLRFDGTDDYLNRAVADTVKHIFIVAAFRPVSAVANRGLAYFEAQPPTFVNTSVANEFDAHAGVTFRRDGSATNVFLVNGEFAVYEALLSSAASFDFFDIGRAVGTYGPWDVCYAALYDAEVTGGTYTALIDDLRTTYIVPPPPPPINGVSGEMQQHLQGTLTVAVFLEITAKDGDVIRVWNGTRDKMVDGELYTAYPVAPSQLATGNGLKADDVEITATYAGLFTAEKLRAKKWQGARVEYRVMNYRDLSMGYAERRVMFLGKSQVGKHASKIELNSLSSKLNEPWGRTCDKECDADRLGDTRCGIDLEGTTVDGFKISIAAVVAAPVLNRQQFSIEFSDYIKPADHGVMTAPDAFYNRGEIHFIDGANAGLRGLILGNSGNALTLYLPLPYEPAADDEIELVTGCDRIITTCRDKFANAERFRGFPYVCGRSKVLKIPE